MPRQVLRVILLSVMVFFLVSDLMELITYLPAASSSLSPLIQRIATIKNLQRATNKLKAKQELPDVERRLNFIDRARGAPHHLASLEPEVRNTNNAQAADSKILGVGTYRKRINLKTGVKVAVTEADLTESEKQQLIELKANWTKVLQDSCLPKLVCELHASLSDGNPLSDAEKGLLSLIKETSIGFNGEVVSKYHFAAHMGQLLSGVEGNGCHNFYPNCPISGSRVLQMVKKVRIK